MFKNTKIFCFVTFLISIYSSCFASSNIAVVDLDYLIQNSNLGKSILNKINKVDEKNISELKIKNKELKDLENQINNKKKLLSNQAFNEEVEKFKVKVSEFKKEKDIMSNEFNKYKNEEITFFFNTISSVINNYMNENSIDILIDKKKIFMGKSNADITEDLLNKINAIKN